MEAVQSCFASSENADCSVSSLIELFEAGFRLHKDLQASTIPLNTKEGQEDVLKAISYLEKATTMVNELSLFSTNEEFDEISTADIKYLLLPAILGSLATRVTSRDRSEVIDVAETYFKDYLRRLKTYGVTNAKIPEPSESEVVCPTDVIVRRQPTIESLEEMARERRDKIARYNRQKELKAKEIELRKRLDTEQFDEELTRNYYRTLLDSWIGTALEEIESIQKEKPILEFMANMKAAGKDAKKVDKQPRKPFKPIIIARNELQKKVIGVGYPSRPILTVDEFYAKRYPEHLNKDPASNNTPSAISMQSMAEDPDRTKKEIEAETAEKEELEDREDKVHMIRERNWDEWKDDHRRGWGNRKNMG